MGGGQVLNQELQEISEQEGKAAIKTMKSGNAAGCDDLWRWLEDRAVVSHTMNMWEIDVDARLRREVVIGDQQYGFME